MSFNVTLSDFQNFIQPNNLFDSQATFILPFFDLLILLFGLIIFIGIQIKLFYWLKFKKNLLYRQFSDKILSCHLVCGFIGLGLVFCNYEKVVFLSMPFLILLIILVYIGWVFYLFYYRFRIMSEKLLNFRIDERKQEYLRKTK